MIGAYTFELGKCYEQTIKERQLQALANIDTGLCAAVATGLGMPAPQATVPLTDETPSGALSQIGGTWPVAGRQVGIVADETSTASHVTKLRDALFRQGVVPLVIAPHGGTLDDGTPIQRTYATASSIEFDALILTCSAAPAPDAVPSLDAKAGVDGSVVDPRVHKLIAEVWRHSKPLVAVDDGSAALDAAGVPGQAPGVLTAGPGSVVSGLLELLASHRVWERFTPAS